MFENPDGMSSRPLSHVYVAIAKGDISYGSHALVVIGS